jgi:capsule polysaccharide export protein KpsE/RkpR
MLLCHATVLAFPRKIDLAYDKICTGNSVRRAEPAVNFSSSAPVLKPAPTLREDDLPAAPGTDGTPQDSGNSVAYLQLLWRHRRVLARVALYGLLTSTILALLIPVRFESTARLMPPDSSQSGGLAMAAAALSGGAGGLSGIATEMLGLKSTSDIFVGILSSRTVQDKLIQQFDLKKLYGNRRMEDARIDLAEHTRLSVDRKSQIIAITVADHDPKRAAAICQAYVAELNRLVAELSTSSARRERIFLEERLLAVNRDLESAEKEFSQFSSKNTAIDIKEQGKAMVEAAALLQGQLIAAESEYEGLKQIYADNNVRVRSVKARIDELKHQLEKLGGKGENATSISDQPGDSLYPSIRKLPLLGVTYADLYRRTRVQEAVFESLTKEYELAKVQEVKEIPVVKVLDIPNIPDKKSFPPRLLIMLLGTALAFAVATTWVFGKAAWDQTDSINPRKVFAQEVFDTVRASIATFAQNGYGDHSVIGKPWNWFRSGQHKHKASK